MCSWCQIFWILNFRHFFTSKFVLHLCFVCKSKDSVSKSILKWEECELLCGPFRYLWLFFIIDHFIMYRSVQCEFRHETKISQDSLQPFSESKTTPADVQIYIYIYIYIYFTRYCQHTLVSVVWNCVFAVLISCSCLVAGVLFEGFLCM